MALVIKVAISNALVDTFLCKACEQYFNYGTGFPDFCPECGEEFTETDEDLGD